MTRLITRSGSIKILLITVVGLIVLPNTPGFKQHWNLRLAAAHAEMLKPLIHADMRFQRVKVSTYTGWGGSLMLHGTVEAESDKDALKAVVDASKPPVHVVFAVSTLTQMRNPISDEVNKSTAMKQ